MRRSLNKPCKCGAIDWKPFSYTYKGVEKKSYYCKSCIRKFNPNFLNGHEHVLDDRGVKSIIATACIASGKNISSKDITEQQVEQYRLYLLVYRKYRQLLKQKTTT